MPVSADSTAKPCYQTEISGACVEDRLGAGIETPFDAAHDAIEGMADTLDRGHDAVRAASNFINGTPAPKNRLLRIPVDAVAGSADLAVTVGGHTAVGALEAGFELLAAPFKALGSIFKGIFYAGDSLVDAGTPEVRSAE